MIKQLLQEAMLNVVRAVIPLASVGLVLVGWLLSRSGTDTIIGVVLAVSGFALGAGHQMWMWLDRQQRAGTGGSTIETPSEGRDVKDL